MAKTTTGKTQKSAEKAKRPGAFSLSPEPVLGGKIEEDVHKYEATREPAPVPAFEDLGSLPKSYGKPTLFLIARDPHWLFCYWDFNTAEHRDQQFFLKIYADGNEESSIEINPEARNWYVPVTKTGATYYAELGYRDEGKWTSLVRSENTVAPTDKLSETAEATFATVPFHLTFQRLLDMVRTAMHKGETLVQALARLQGDGRSAIAGGNVADWTDEQRQLLASLFNNELVDRLGMSSAEIDQVLRQHLQEKLNTESASELVAKGRLQALSVPGESSLFSAAFGALAESAWGSEVTSWFSGIGSSWSAQPFSEEKSRDFFMHVNAEVIFYGGTHPDAQVWIDGKQIQLNPDGSFRFHFRFPDGNYEIPIVAKSPDKVEERSASLTFDRATVRKGTVGSTAQPEGLGTPMGGKR